MLQLHKKTPIKMVDSLLLWCEFLGMLLDGSTAVGTFVGTAVGKVGVKVGTSVGAVGATVAKLVAV